jgi:hypothetical protein
LGGRAVMSKKKAWAAGGGEGTRVAGMRGAQLARAGVERRYGVVRISGT